MSVMRIGLGDTQLVSITRLTIGFFSIFWLISTLLFASTTFGQQSKLPINESEFPLEPGFSNLTKMNKTIANVTILPLLSTNITKQEKVTMTTEDSKIRQIGVIISAIVIAISMATIVLAAFYWLYFDKQEDQADQQNQNNNREIKNAAMKSLQQKAPPLAGTTIGNEESSSNKYKRINEKISSNHQQPTIKGGDLGLIKKDFSKSLKNKKFLSDKDDAKDQKMMDSNTKNKELFGNSSNAKKQQEPSLSKKDLSKKNFMSIEPSQIPSQMPYSDVLSAASISSNQSKNDSSESFIE